MDQIEFESKLVAFITDSDHKGLKLMREQLYHAKVVSREMTGVGFYTNYTVDPSCVKPFQKEFSFGDVMIKTDDMKEGAGVVVHIKSGYVAILECYTFGDSWSENYPNLLLSYSPDPRDLTKLDDVI